MDRGGAPPEPGIAPLRWGIPDSAIAWFLSLVAAVVALAPFTGTHGVPHRDEAVATVVGLAAQTLAVVAYVAAIARRKGRGALTGDFGLRIRLTDTPWFVVGFLLALLATGMLQPIIDLGHIGSHSQDVVRIFDESKGVKAVLFAISVVVVAPVGEELLFRGVLLRSLQRRLSTAMAVFVSAGVFALVHVVLDPGTGFAVPALLLLGLLSGWRAVLTGSLSQSIYLHAGFNLLAAVSVLT